MTGGHADHGDLSKEQWQKLDREAHFTGPPEEDPIMDLVLCPWRTFPKPHSHDHERSNEEREYLTHVIHDNEHDPAILWFGLFTDLIFVAVIVKFADQFKYFYKYKEAELNLHGADKTEFYMRIIGETALFFFGFFSVWMELCQANTRFVNMKGALDDSLFFVYLCGIIIMAVQMDPNDFLMEHNVGFMCGLLICVFAMFLLHCAYWRYIPKSRRYSERRLKCYAFGSIVLAVGVIVAASAEDKAVGQWFSAWCIIIACTAMLTVSLVSFRVDPRYENWTLHYFQERFGILVMIVTGESILALIVGDKSSAFSYYTATTNVTVWDDVTSTYVVTTGTTEVTNYYYNHLGYYYYQDTGAFFQTGGENLRDYVGVLTAFATMYILKNIYFESEAEPHEHALQEEGHPGSVVWVLLHYPLTFCLLGCGVGYKLLFTTLHEDETEQATHDGYRLITGLCVCGSIVCMLVIRAAHDKFIFPICSMAIRIPTALLIPLGVFFIDSTIEYMMWCLFFVILSWIYDLTIMDYLEVKKPAQAEEEHEVHGRHKLKNIVEHQKPTSGPCQGVIDICGLDDKEFAGAFHGPKYEGNPCYLLMDVLACRICEDAASAKGVLPDHYIEEISQPHTGHGHGHGDAHGDGHGDHDPAAHDHGHGHVEDADESGADHGWFGEFTDLIYVSIIIKFADQMKYKQTTMYLQDDELVETDWEHCRIILEAALIFMAFFVTWLELTHLLIRFKNMPGIFDDIMYFLYLCGVIGMAVQMNHYEYLLQRREAFCFWFAFSMFCLVILHLKLRTIDAAEEYCKKRIIAFLGSTILAVVGAFMDEVGAAVLLCLSYTVALWVSLNSFRVWAESQPDPHIQFEYTERFGLIIMITTGESILALVLAEFEQEVEYYAMVLLAFLTMYVMKSIYFESHSEQPKMHALAEGGMPGSVLWAFLHAPAAFFLLGCGVGYKMLVGYANKDNVDNINRYILGFSILGSIFTIYVIRAAHNKFILPIASLLIRVPVACAAPLGAVFIDAPLAYVSWCCSIVCISFALDLLLIKSLQFEIHQDFKIHHEEVRREKVKKVLHKRKSSMGVDNNEIEMAAMDH